MQLQINQPKTKLSSHLSPVQSKIHNPKSKIITRVILIRHGRSTYNEQGRYQGSCDDSVLTAKGQKMACQTGLALQEFDIDAIYTSPLQRVQQTTRDILSALSIKGDRLPSVCVAEQLKEIYMAAWQGLSYQYVKDNFAEDYRCWKECPHEFRFSVEGKPYFPIPELYKTAHQFWQDILPKHQGQTVLIVAHGGTNRALISTAMGLSPERYHTLQQSNCGISILEFNETLTPLSPPLFKGGSPEEKFRGEVQKGSLEEEKRQTSSVQLTALNLTAHLGETLPKLKEGKQGLRLLLLPSTTTEAQAQHLAKILEETSLNFILSADLYHSRAIAEPFLAIQPTAVHLQVLREDFPNAWRQVLVSRRASDRQQTELVTGLLIAKETILQDLLESAIPKRVSNAIGTQTAQLEPGTLSILHYPQVGCPPVLQALNFSYNRVFALTCSRVAV
jgi:phosphoserine phosphatase